jgi:hypothetical protein
MSKTKEMSFTLGRTYNLGNCESKRIEMSITVSLDETDNIHDVKDKSMEWLKSSVKDAFVKSQEKRN